MTRIWVNLSIAALGAVIICATVGVYAVGVVLIWKLTEIGLFAFIWPIAPIACWVVGEAFIDWWH